MPVAHSIKRELLLRLLGPMLALTLFAGLSAYGISSHLGSMVLDQWLYDAAISLATRVREVDGRITVVIGKQGRAILEWDAVDQVFYEVTNEKGELLAANASIPKLPKLFLPGQDRIFYDAFVRNAPVRVVALPVSLKGHDNVLVKVAETRNKKSALTTQALWISIGVSLLTAALSAVFIWRGIRNGIKSTEQAIRAISEQHASAPLQPISVHQDMPTEIEPLVAEINRLIAGLGAAHRLNQRFTADAAHQLRTPLATLQVQHDRARRERNPEFQAKAMQETAEALTRMSRVVHQLLTLAKAEYAEVLVRTRIDLDQIAREELERHLDKAAAFGVDFGYAGPGTSVYTYGQVELVSEAVSNLIENALQYGVLGGRVTVGVSSIGPEIYIEDAGPGIASADLQKVRERFYRIPGSKGEGCGLGLSIVEEIARQNSASLILESGTGGVGLRARFIFSGSGVVSGRT